MDSTCYLERTRECSAVDLINAVTLPMTSVTACVLHALDGTDHALGRTTLVPDLKQLWLQQQKNKQGAQRMNEIPDRSKTFLR